MNTTLKTNSTTTSNPISDLLASVMDKYDTNKDKQLNANEFSSFLRGLIEGAGTSTLSKVSDSGAADPTSTTPASAAADPNAPFDPTPYNPGFLHGFAADNYYKQDMMSMKYQFARIAADYDPRQPGALDRVIGDPRFKAAFPNAKKVGKDCIDFGGQLSDISRGVPVGLVDVGEAFLDNSSGVAWQWLDQTNV